MLINQEIL